jgi:hypothetical protein
MNMSPLNQSNSRERWQSVADTSPDTRGDSQIAGPDDIGLDAQIAALELRLAKLQHLRRLQSEIARIECRRTAVFGCFELAVELICARFGVHLAELLGRGRNVRLTWPRHLVAWLCRKYSEEPLQRIARQMHRKDHCTPRHSVRAVADRMSVEPPFAALVREIEAELQRRMAKGKKPTGGNGENRETAGDL